MVRTLHLEAWAGRWVALDAHDVVRCDAATLAELLKIIERDGLRDVEVMRAPAPDEPLVYGLG
jgi:ABC-type transporter Mla MlaB component